jgi:hypothetical protein
METWTILLIILAILFVIGTVYYVRKKRASSVSGPSLGVQLRKGAENIPVYGTFVKVAGVVGKPVNNVLDKFTGYQVTALKHIPVVGNIAAKPLEYSQKYVKQLNNWLGL